MHSTTQTAVVTGIQQPVESSTKQKATRFAKSLRVTLDYMLAPDIDRGKIQAVWLKEEPRAILLDARRFRLLIFNPGIFTVVKGAPLVAQQKGPLSVVELNPNDLDAETKFHDIMRTQLILTETGKGVENFSTEQKVLTKLL